MERSNTIDAIQISDIHVWKPPNKSYGVRQITLLVPPSTSYGSRQINMTADIWNFVRSLLKMISKGFGAIYHSYGFKHWIEFCRCLLFFPMQLIWPVNTDKMRFNTSFYNKVCRGIAYFNTKISYLSDFECTKNKTLRTTSTGRIANWTKPSCEPVQIIRTKDRYF